MVTFRMDGMNPAKPVTWAGFEMVFDYHQRCLTDRAALGVETSLGASTTGCGTRECHGSQWHHSFNVCP